MLSWDGEDVAVAFDGQQGHTHLIDALAFELLNALRGASTAPELAAAVAATVDEADRPRLLEHVETALLSLQDAGLVIATPSH